MLQIDDDVWVCSEKVESIHYRGHFETLVVKMDSGEEIVVHENYEYNLERCFGIQVKKYEDN